MTYQNYESHTSKCREQIEFLYFNSKYLELTIFIKKNTLSLKGINGIRNTYSAQRIYIMFAVMFSNVARTPIKHRNVRYKKGSMKLD